MRSRAALLPHPADPFLLKYWLKFYNEIWRDEVDKLYIFINSPMEEPVIEYMRSLVADDPKIKLMYVGYQIEHGAAIKEMLEACEETEVMLIEDDGFIFKKGVVDVMFELLETQGMDVVGSPRGSCSQVILDQAKERWGLNYDGMGDKGCNFWPNFLFAHKATLLATDRFYGARAWNKGDYIQPLDYTYMGEDTIASDTFVYASLQLRNMVPKERIAEVPQYHGSPDDMDHYGNQQWLFDGKAPWIHVGSLSTGTHGVLMDDYGRPLARRTIDPEKDKAVLGNYCNTEGERNEWERRVSFWKLFLENADKDAIPEFKQLYINAIQRIINQYELSISRIERRMNIYHTLGL